MDEGKFSILLIHALKSLPKNQAMILRNVLTQRRTNGSSSLDHKQLILHFMEQCGSFEYTQTLLRKLQMKIYKEIQSIEDTLNIENKSLRGLLKQLFI